MISARANARRLASGMCFAVITLLVGQQLLAHELGESSSRFVLHQKSGMLTGRLRVSIKLPRATALGLAKGVNFSVASGSCERQHPVSEPAIRQSVSGPVLQFELTYLCPRKKKLAAASKIGLLSPRLEFIPPADLGARHLHYATLVSSHQGKETSVDALLVIRGASPTVHVFDLTKTHGGATSTPSTPTLGSFVGFGFSHVLNGYDHIAFLLALLLAVRGRRQWVIHVTGFTVGHAIALTAVVLGRAQPNALLTELLIAFSIWVMAFRAWSSYGRSEEPSDGGWLEALPILTLLFGAVHGLGLAGGLQAFDLEGWPLVVALLSLNVGIELSQLLLVCVFAAIFFGATYVSGEAPRKRLRQLGAATIASMGAFWFMSRLLGA